MPEPVEPPEGGKNLEDLIAGLDDDAKATVLGEVRKARVEAKGLRDRLKAAEDAATAEAARLRAATLTEAERATEAAKRSDDKVSKVFTNLAQAKIEAAAAGRFADPDDATSLLNPAKYVNDDGDVDTAGIKADLDELLSRKPHLAAKRGPRPDPSQGAGSGAAGLTPADSWASWLKGQLNK